MRFANESFRFKQRGGGDDAGPKLHATTRYTLLHIHTHIYRVRVALTLTKRERGPKGLIRTIGFSSSVAIK